MKKTFFVLIASLAFGGALYNFSPKKVALTPDVESYRLPAATDVGSCGEAVAAFFEAPKFKIPSGKLAKVRAIAKEYGVKEADLEEITHFDDAIDMVYKKLVGANRTTSVAKGEKMAQFGKKLREIYKPAVTEKAKLLDLDFILAHTVMKAEAYTPKEFVKKSNSEFALGKNTDLYHIDYKNYKKYTIAFEDNLPAYTNLDRSGGTIIDRKDIREIEAHNLFPVYIDHDMTHVRYALHHERYFPMIFGAARSKNHKRYVMTGALGEGADTVQYSEESAICRYFDGLGMTLEEAMMWLGRATDEELDEVAEKTGYKSQFDQLASVFANWAPPYSTTHSVKGVNDVGFDQEIEDMFLYLKKHHTDADIKARYKNRESQIKHW